MTNTSDFNESLRGGVAMYRVETQTICFEIASMDALRADRTELAKHFEVEMLVLTVGLVAADGIHSAQERELIGLVTEGAQYLGEHISMRAPIWRTNPGADILVREMKELFPQRLTAPSAVMVKLVEIDRVVGTQFATRYRDAAWRYALLVASCDGPMTVEEADSVTRYVGAMNQAISRRSAPATEAASAAAQWAPDPFSRFELRYWNGSQWTDEVSTGGVVGRDPLP